jgi:flagellar biosynthesis protein FlhF
MRLKSYFADSVEAAVSLARLELGPDAMLMNSQRNTTQSGQGEEYEVVFATTDPALAGRELRGAGISTPVVDRLALEVADLKRQLERTASIFHRAASFPSPEATGGPEFFHWFSALVAAGLEPGIAHNLLSSVRQAGETSGHELDARVREALQKLVVTDSSGGAEETKPKVMALAGPPGAGKTTTLVKLALARGLALHKRVHLVSTDAYRIGGSDQLRTFAAVLGVSFEVADGEAALQQTLEAFRHCDLILIDTPGLDSRHQDLIRDSAEAIAAHPGIDTHLVLPASARSGSLRRLALAYEPYQADKLIFTKLDEAEGFGNLMNHALWSRKPISFLTDGQSIPEDLRAATPGEIADLVLDRGREAAAAAAA